MWTASVPPFVYTGWRRSLQNLYFTKHHYVRLAVHIVFNVNFRKWLRGLLSILVREQTYYMVQIYMFSYFLFPARPHLSSIFFCLYTVLPIPVGEIKLLFIFSTPKVLTIWEFFQHNVRANNAPEKAEEMRNHCCKINSVILKIWILILDIFRMTFGFRLLIILKSCLLIVIGRINLN